MGRRTLLLVCTALLLLALLNILQTNSQIPSEVNKQIHPLIFFEESSFYKGVTGAENASPSSYTIAGGIIPHHLLPSYIIADFFQRLSQQKPKTVILIGPNHYERGNYQVLTSKKSWKTPFGVVGADEEIIDMLLAEKLAYFDSDVLTYEHSVAGIMPFIKYYLPDAKVVPIIVKRSMTQEEVRFLVDHFVRQKNKEVVFIASVDFSHYLTSAQAEEKDKETKRILQTRDYKNLFVLGNDYLDSPQSVALLLMLMENLHTTNLDILYHTNSGRLLKNPIAETTSYFSLAFH